MVCGGHVMYTINIALIQVVENTSHNFNFWENKTQKQNQTKVTKQKALKVR